MTTIKECFSSSGIRYCVHISKTASQGYMWRVAIGAHDFIYSPAVYKTIRAAEYDARTAMEFFRMASDE